MPCLDWMAAARNPASMLRSMQTPTFWVTRDLINGGIEVGHAGLDAVAPRAPPRRSVRVNRREYAPPMITSDGLAREGDPPAVRRPCGVERVERDLRRT